MEVNEKDKVCDGIKIYDKVTYIEEVYPAMKARAREVHVWLNKTGGGMAFSAESDMDHRYHLERGRWYNQKEYVNCGDMETWN